MVWIMNSASPSLIASGFSHSTGRPCRAASVTFCRWAGAAEVTTTASSPDSKNMSLIV